MTQLHRRFTDDQVRVLVNGTRQGLLKRAEVQDMLGVGTMRCLTPVSADRHDPEDPLDST